MKESDTVILGDSDHPPRRNPNRCPDQSKGSWLAYRAFTVVWAWELLGKGGMPSEEEEDDMLPSLDDPYSRLRRWVIALLGPGVVVAEAMEGRFVLASALAFGCVALWAHPARRLGAIGSVLNLVERTSLAIAGALLVLHYALWWAGRFQ